MQKPVDMGDSAASSAVDWKRRLKLIFSVPMLGSVAGLAIGLIPFLQKHLLLEPPPILAAAVQSSRILAGCFLGSACVILGASLALTYQNIKSKQKNQLTRQALIMSMIGKLVISPLLSAFVTLLLWEWPFMFPEEARDPLLLFTLLIESAAPCAQSLNMQSMMTGYARDEVSVVILSQYIASIVTMTIWVMAFMSIVPMMSVS
jgi:predicted permease